MPHNRPLGTWSTVLIWVVTMLQFAMAIFGIVIIIADVNTLWYLIWIALAGAYAAIRWVAAMTGWHLQPITLGVLANLARIGSALIASLVGITAATMVTFDTGDDNLNQATRLIGVPMVLLAWNMLHFGYSDLYQASTLRSQRDGSPPPLVFPGDTPPVPSDYVYFSFTVATTFATSDVAAMTARIRRTILTHSVAAFLYNAAILSIAIGVITSKS